MKNSVTNILPPLSWLVFVSFWIFTTFLSLPLNFTQKIIHQYAPGLNKIFSKPWRLFSPPPTFNYRLYVITSSLNTPKKTTTLEIMEQLSIQKRLRAPFNQKENLLEIIVNNNTAVIVNTVWTKRQITAFGFSFLPDSLAIAGAIEKVAFNKNYIAGVATIQNYCMAVLKTQKMDLRNTEVKMVIAQKLIRPFREMNNPGYLPTETIVFETTLLHAIL